MTSKTFGYIRVSSKEQNLERQRHELKKYGVDERNFYEDKASGKDFNRPQFQDMISRLREGDTVVICSLDRLGRNYTLIKDAWELITKKLKCDIVVLDSSELSTNNKDGDLVKQVVKDVIFTLLSYVAQAQRESIKASQKQGIDNCQRTGHTKTGRPYGRPKIKLSSEEEKAFREDYMKALNKEIKQQDVMAKYDLKRTTYYKLITELGLPKSNKGRPIEPKEKKTEQ